ncbi:MAG: DnaB-like helicase C-terminal domain-containing protein [Kiritimatiellae bacterium]|nr:DnaB-like helicase C-terminal domain-containing protein [Kiritimatiellia bacterium]
MIEKGEIVAEAESGIIGGALTWPANVVPRCIEAGVTADWFSSDKWKVAWCAVLDVFGEHGVPADDGDNAGFVLAVLDRVRKIIMAPDSQGKVDVSTADIQKAMDGVVVVSHLDYHLQVLRSEVMLRRLSKAQGEFTKALSIGLDPSDAIAELNTRITSILASSMGAKTVPPAKILDRILDTYREAHRIRIDEHRLDYTPGIPLPWPAVNQKANGVQEGLYYVGARPSVGKTAFMLNLIRFWCERGINVGFDSLDMAVVQLMKRPLGEYSRVSFNKASFGTTTREDLAAMERATAEIAKWPLTLVDFRDVDRLRAWAVAMRAVGKLDVLVVDFVQLLRASRRFSNTEERIEYVSGVLKSIAIDLNIPVIALSQLNRECEKDGGRVPTASDLRGSGALEQDAFAVWILHREKEVKTAWMTPDSTGKLGAPIGLTPSCSLVEFKGIDPVRMIIAKNQNGQAGPDIWFPFVFYKKYCCIMLGNWEAQPLVKSSGYGVTAKTTSDYSPLYSKVHADWRHDPLEAALRQNGTLIEEVLPQPPPPVPQDLATVADDDEEEEV